MLYREEVAQPAKWCSKNNLSLNVGKVSVMDFRRNSVDLPLIISSFSEEMSQQH